MFHTFEAFSYCTGRSQPGTRNLATAIDGAWSQAIVGYPYGIYNCRPPSLHGEGRALDVGFPGVSNPQGTALVKVLVKNAWELGLMGVIWNRTRWSRRSPYGTPYTGASPHTDHVHIEQTWYASRTNPLTLAKANSLVRSTDMAFTAEQEAWLKRLATHAEFLANFAAEMGKPGPTTGNLATPQSLVHLLEVHRLVAADAGVSGVNHVAIKDHLVK